MAAATDKPRALRISLTDCRDLATVASLWRALEPRADCSFFRSWIWVGCLAESRFTRPVLLEARWRDRVVALGLMNRHGWHLEPDTLWLGESGVDDFDAVFVEHNGLLVEAGWSGILASQCLRALVSHRLDARHPSRGRRVMLNGVDGRVLKAFGRRNVATAIKAARAAPLVDLVAVRDGGGDYLAGLSANARYQIRRSNRRFAAAGPLLLHRADTPETAHGYLQNLARLHQLSWTRRHQPGAFGNASLLAFHHALIDRGFADGTIDLLRVSAGDREIGYLYNFRFRGRVSAYQSGFAYDPDDAQLKPGLTSHAMAIEQALAEGCTVYDFLAGDSQYKRSLSNAAETLYWLDAVPTGSARGLARYGRKLLGGR